jgi:hypothetical protein
VDAQLLLRYSFGTFPGASLVDGLLTGRDTSAAQITQRLAAVQLPLS